MTVLSLEPLSDVDRERIEGIMRESLCPSESLRATFPNRFAFMTDSLILFDVSQVHFYRFGGDSFG